MTSPESLPQEQAPSPDSAPAIASPDDIDAAFADRAFAGTSWTPERRGYLYREDYAGGVNSLYAELWPLAKTPEQRALLAAEMETFRQGSLRRMNAYLASHAGVVSSFIAGPSKFPAERMRKRSAAADKKLQEFTDWRAQARKAIERKLLDARPEETRLEDDWSRLRSELARSLAMVAAIDQRNVPYERPAFTGSIAGKLERLAKNGELELVEKALAWLAEHNLDSGKPAFTTRHRVWRLAAEARQSVAALAARVAKESELVAEASGIELWADYRADRAQLIFPDKPGHAVREQLKRSGWRWSPTNGAWQRQLTDSALAAGKQVLAGLEPPAPPPATQDLGR